MLLKTIILSIVIFLAVIWLLVGLLLFARKRLVPDGKVKITINGEREIQHERGCSLLQALSDEKVFMPSACGGGGTCGTCKGKVLAPKFFLPQHIFDKSCRRKPPPRNLHQSYKGRQVLGI